MRRHSSIPKSIWLLIVALLSSGCGDPEKHADARRTSYEAYEKGLVAFRIPYTQRMVGTARNDAPKIRDGAHARDVAYMALKGSQILTAIQTPNL